MQDARTRLEAILRERIAVLDGSWGVLIQREVKGEEAYRGERFKDHPRDVAGDPDLLNLTRPEVVLGIHRDYFAAGADIATTNTFTATTIGQADYGLEDHAYEMNVEGARLARQAADEVGGFVAGSVGPLNVTLSLSPRVDDPAFRTHTFDQVYETYAEQIRGLAEGGVDFLLIETIFDTLNAKAAIAAALDVAPELPLWISFTAIDRSGRNLSGQTVDAFWLSVEHARPFIVGVNCSLGATQMRPFVEDLARVAPTWVACHPNAGLPNEMGTHDEQPQDTSQALREFAQDGLVNIVGGCCGTTPEHVKAITATTKGQTPRRVPEGEGLTRLSGLEPFRIFPESNFVMVGERTNVTGSARFRRLIEGGEFQEAVEVALEQVRGGANILDVNMDEDLLDRRAGDDDVPQPARDRAGRRAHPDHGRQLASGPCIEAGLKCLQGKGDRQLDQPQGGRGGVPRAGAARQALRRGGRRDGVRRAGPGRHRRAQGATSATAPTSCSPADGFTPEDIIFDPNILAVATGIEEHDELRQAFIEGARQIKERCPGVQDLRRHLATSASRSAATTPCARRCTRRSCTTPSPPASTWASSTPASSRSTRRSSRSLLERVEDVIFNRRPDATERLVEYAVDASRARRRSASGDLSWRDAPVEERLSHALVHGIVDFIEADTEEARQQVRPPARRDRRPADGRHGDRRRPVRLRQDVPAPGGEERPRDEARRGLPRAVHGGGEGRRSRHAHGAGKGRARHGEGRRARHRQEHRRGRAGPRPSRPP